MVGRLFADGAVLPGLATSAIVGLFGGIFFFFVLDFKP
jgi:hypothetical protein